MHLVHDEVARLEVVVVVDRLARAAGGAVHAAAAGEVALGHQREVRGGQDHAALERRDEHRDRAGRDRRADERVDPLAREHVGQPARRAVALGGEHHPVLGAHERADALGERLDVADHGVERGRAELRGVGPVGRR